MMIGTINHEEQNVKEEQEIYQKHVGNLTLTFMNSVEEAASNMFETDKPSRVRTFTSRPTIVNLGDVDDTIIEKTIVCSKCGKRRKISEFEQIEAKEQLNILNICDRCLFRIRKGFITTMHKMYVSMIKSSLVKGLDIVDFSLSDFMDWCKRKDYFDLWYEWGNHEYSKTYAPCTVRLDTNKPFSVNNLRLTTWGELRKELEGKRNGGTKQDIPRKDGGDVSRPDT